MKILYLSFLVLDRLEGLGLSEVYILIKSLFTSVYNLFLNFVKIHNFSFVRINNVE